MTVLNLEKLKISQAKFTDEKNWIKFSSFIFRYMENLLKLSISDVGLND